MWQFGKTVEGLSDGCLELEIPVTGGNVSFYNQTGDVPIHPTPVIAVLGVIDDVARRIPSGWQDEGNNIYLLGLTRDELDGSAWAGTIHEHLGGVPPQVDLASEMRLAGLIAAGGEQSLIASAHDLADGGLAQALAEAVMRFGIGARVWITEIMQRDGVDATAALFSESAGRMLVSVPREDDVRFQGLCEGRGYPVLRIGVTEDSGALELQDRFTIPVEELRAVHQAPMASRFGAVIGQ
jgi:phosphoribosylformylglycinamidine synthase